jgi:hypothetical protein
MAELMAQQLEDCRSEILRHIDSQSATADLRQRAKAELIIRLRGWYGDFVPLPSQFKKSKFPIAQADPIPVPADPIELLIVRAVSMTFPAAQFGVSPNGEVFTAYGNGWTMNGPRFYVTRLSWLLDEAADVFNHRRGGRGGRFYERDGSFFMADGKATFLRVVEPAGWWQDFESSVRGFLGSDENSSPKRVDRALRHNAARVRRASVDEHRIGRPPMRCSLHNIELAVTGECDECSKLITPGKPWWRFW